MIDAETLLQALLQAFCWALRVNPLTVATPPLVHANPLRLGTRVEAFTF